MKESTRNELFLILFAGGRALRLAWIEKKMALCILEVYAEAAECLFLKGFELFSLQSENRVKINQKNINA